MDKWEVADNIDLYYIVQDFEEYYEMKFMRKPVLTRKCNGGDESNSKKSKVMLPKASSQQRDTAPVNSNPQRQGSAAINPGAGEKIPPSVGPPGMLKKPKSGMTP